MIEQNMEIGRTLMDKDHKDLKEKVLEERVISEDKDNKVEEVDLEDQVGMAQDHSTAKASDKVHQKLTPPP